MEEKNLKPFNTKNLYGLLYEYQGGKLLLPGFIHKLNEIADAFYKQNPVVEKQEIDPFEKTQITKFLMALEVGESIYTEEESFRNKLKAHANRIRIEFGKKFTTRKHGKGWMTFRME